MTAGHERRLRIGVLGCGPIAQAAHLESCVKARNADLYAICDVAEDLVERMACTYQPLRTYTKYADMLADPAVEAVVIATSDTFHVLASIAALEAGKHVLCEKPVGTTVEEVERLREAVHASGRTFQVGHMKRFDSGIQSAKAFIDEEMGEMLACKAWYADSTHRYAMTDAVQPSIITSSAAKRPDRNPKADLRQYYLLAHGSHLVDTARYLGGPIVEVQARLAERYGARCWFVDVAFASGALGHLDLTIAVRMDWHEGFQIYGEHGSVSGKIFNPWYYKTSEVDVFRESTGATSRVLGADGHFYRRQLEGFADVILHDSPMQGTDIDEGLESIRALAAIAESVRTGKPVKLADATGGP